MTYTDWKIPAFTPVKRPFDPIWWDLHSTKQEKGSEVVENWLTVREAGLDAILDRAFYKTREEVNPLDYTVAADYIEENWDRLLSIAETAEGVDPKPLLERLLSRLRAEWADYQNGVAK